MQNNKLLNVVDLGDSFECKAPRSKKHLGLYFAIVFNCRIPSTTSDNEYCVKNEHKSPLDAMWAAYAELDDLSLWYAMRGTGKTFDLSLLSFVESVFKRNCGSNILGGSLEQSTRAVVYLKNLWDIWKNTKNIDKLDIGLKQYDLKELKYEYSSRNIANQLLGENKEVAGRGFKLSNGSWINALAASTKSVRGPHPQKLRLDEVDEMDKKIRDAAMGQPKANFGIKDNIIMSSTLHNPFGQMAELIDSRFDLGAELYAWCVKEMIYPRGFWTFDELMRRKRQIPKAMWEAEYLLKRPKSDETIFDFESVNRAYTRGRNDKHDKELYTEAGLDWGYNCTVFNLIQDNRENFRNIESYPFENVELTERCYQMAEICIDREVKVIFADSNPKDSNITFSKILKEKRTNVNLVPVAFNKWKDIGINVLRFLLEKDLINISDKICQDKLKKYHYKNVDLEIIAKEDDHYPDSLIAWAASKYQWLGDNIKIKTKKKGNEKYE